MCRRLSYKRAVTVNFVVLTEDWVPSGSVSTDGHGMRMIGRDHYQRVVFVSEIDSDSYSLGEFLCFIQWKVSLRVMVRHVNPSTCYQYDQKARIKSKKSKYFDVHVTVHRETFLIIKPTRCTNFSNLFLEWNSTCFGQFLFPSSGVFHCTHSNGICHTVLQTACEHDRDGTAVPSWSCSRAVSKPVGHIPLLCVQWKTPDGGQRNCPKHVEFHFKDKLEKLVHLFGFIIRNLNIFNP